MSPELFLFIWKLMTKKQVTYLVIYLHLNVVSHSRVSVFCRIVEFYVLWVPLDNIGGRVIRRFSNYNRSEISPSSECVIDILSDLRDIGFVGRNECERDGFFRQPPVNPRIFQVNGALLLSWIIAVYKCPVITAHFVVPIRIPVIYNIWLCLNE